MKADSKGEFTATLWLAPELSTSGGWSVDAGHTVPVDPASMLLVSRDRPTEEDHRPGRIPGP